VRVFVAFPPLLSRKSNSSKCRQFGIPAYLLRGTGFQVHPQGIVIPDIASLVVTIFQYSKSMNITHTMKNGFTFTKGCKRLAIASIMVATAAVSARGQSGPVAKFPYAVTVFAAAPQGLTNPDSITAARGRIYVAYANHTQPDGTGGTSTIVEFSPSGIPLRTFSVPGKADGLKYNSYTHQLWAIRDEDSNPALTLIDPKSGGQTNFTFAQMPPHGGGYDDVVFFKNKTFISASNPNLQAPTSTTPNGQNIFPSILEVRLVGRQVFVTPAFAGNQTLIDIASGQTVVAQQSDPDSLKVDAAGDLVLDSQADGDLIFIHAPGTGDQASLRLHLSNGTSTQITVDDTVFPTAPSGTILVVDTALDTIYAVTSNAFQPGGAYSASDSDGVLGKVDLSTGLVTPVVTGMKSPHGALFIPGDPDDHDGDVSTDPNNNNGDN
jgi:hypothetical protein